jgi:SWIM zinc finger
MIEPAGRERTVRLVRPPTLDGAGIFCIRDADRTVFYAFREIPCAIGGRGFAVHKLGLGTLYHVRVGRREQCSCECLGFLSRGLCRHVLALLALVRQGMV